MPASLLMEVFDNLHVRHDQLHAWKHKHYCNFAASVKMLGWINGDWI